MPIRIFISHDFGGKPEAVRFMEIILKAAGGPEFSFFLASDWNSLTSGERDLPARATVPTPERQ